MAASWRFRAGATGTYRHLRAVHRPTGDVAARWSITGDGDQWVNDWSSDGRLLLYSVTTPGNRTRSDLFVFDLTVKGIA